MVSSLNKYDSPEQPPIRENATVVTTHIPDMPVAVRAVAASGSVVPAGSFVLDASGHLVVDANTRQVIAGLLGPDEQAPGSADITHAQAAITAQLKEPALTEALQLLNSFVAYRKAAHEWVAKKTTTAAPANGDMSAIMELQHQTALRNQTLGSAANTAMFGDQEAADRYQLAKKQLMQMNGLSQEQKDEQLATLYQQLPESVQLVVKNAEKMPDGQ